jgi:saccharopine dehydrogenase (NAD+, L-lysine-forming)
MQFFGAKGGTMSHLWLRAEVRPFEKRAPLLPEHASLLIKSGHEVSVESSTQRIFNDKEYEKNGCKMVPAGSWPNAPLDAFILGIKELPSNNFPLRHRHIYLAHVYKKQKGAKTILQRFRQGKGILLDLEYLTDSINHNSLVTKAAGFWAGICGAATSLLIWGQKKLGAEPPFVIPEYYPDFNAMIRDIKKLLAETGPPSVLIIGPNGMTGKGVRELLDKIGMKYKGWTRENTQPPGPFLEILNFNILFNCVLVGKETPQFLTKKNLAKNKKLSIIGDISCDSSSPYNPLPLYESSTTFSQPTVRVAAANNAIDIMAIDNIATLLPKESSRAMCEQIFPYLCELFIMKDDLKYSPWEKALAKFRKYVP